MSDVSEIWDSLRLIMNFSFSFACDSESAVSPVTTCSMQSDTTTNNNKGHFGTAYPLQLVLINGHVFNSYQLGHKHNIMNCLCMLKYYCVKYLNVLYMDKYWDPFSTLTFCAFECPRSRLNTKPRELAMTCLTWNGSKNNKHMAQFHSVGNFHIFAIHTIKFII